MFPFLGSSIQAASCPVFSVSFFHPLFLRHQLCKAKEAYVSAERRFLLKVEQVIVKTVLTAEHWY
jgi:hypothetical protein